MALLGHRRADDDRPVHHRRPREPREEDHGAEPVPGLGDPLLRRDRQGRRRDRAYPARPAGCRVLQPPAARADADGDRSRDLRDCPGSGAGDPHPAYKKYTLQWQRCRDTAEGEDAVKARGQVYLPQLEGTKNPRERNKGYEDYKERASFYGAMGRTVLGLTGAVMRNPPALQGTPLFVPQGSTATDVVLTEVEVGLASETVAAMIHSTVSEVLEVGRVGHLVDALPKDQAEGGLIRPYVVEYSAEDILIWHQQVVRGRNTLVFLVLRETTSEPDSENDFRMVPSVQYRVLRMVDRVPGDDVDTIDELFLDDDFSDGAIYIQEIWVDPNETGKGKNKMVLKDRVVPRHQNGRPFPKIPFRFTNWDGSAPAVSKPPLIDLASVNISHYRNSADLEHGRHYVAMPTPWAAGFKLAGDKLEIGPRTAWISEEPGARVGMLEFTGAGLGHVADGMRDKENQMAVLGARLLDGQRPGVEAAETVRLRQSGDRSVLAGITASISDSWTWILLAQWGWINTAPPPEDITVELNTDFSSAQMDPTMLAGMIAALQTGSISWLTFVENLQRGEIISSKITAEEEAERIVAGAPSVTLGTTGNNQQFPEPARDPEPTRPPDPDSDTSGT